MATCPKGHDSTTDDYCDQCGTPIPGGAPTAGAQAGGASTAAAPTGPAEGAPSTNACPQCGTPRNGRFCEVDGYDFVAADLGGGPPATAPVPGGPTTAPTPPPNGGPPPIIDPPPATGAPATGPVLRVALSADHEYHQRILALNGPDAAAVSFPAFYPPRQFQLGTGQLLIGRRSRSRGIEPQIDLTGPPEDPGVSHSHALLVPGGDGGWSVVDLDSANGTYLNESSEPLSPNTPVPLQVGDRIHLGAWTTLTLGTG